MFYYFLTENEKTGRKCEPTHIYVWDINDTLRALRRNGFWVEGYAPVIYEGYCA